MAENKLADMSTEFAVKILNVTGGIKGHNIVIISYDKGRILYGKTIFVDNEHRRKHTVLS